MVEKEKEIKNAPEDPYDQESGLFRLKKARVWLNRNKPFFGYLTMQLDFVRMDEIKTIGVDNHGNCYYCKDFICSLTPDEARGVITHEIMHLALEHLTRVSGRDKELWNISADAVINGMLLEEGLSLPDCGIKPHKGLFKFFTKEIKDVHKKTTEEVYDKIYDEYKKNMKNSSNSALGDGNSDGRGDGSANGQMPKGFDKHKYGNGKHGNKRKGDKNSKGNDNLKKSSGIEDAKDWKEILSEAAAFGKMRGNLPAGLERQLEKVLGSFIDWKGILYRYITNMIPYDFTWGNPSKKSFSLGVYLPNTVKEKLDVVVDIDTSGSIGEKELSEFLGEVIGIIKGFSNVDLTVIFNDTRVYGPHKFRNPTPETIIRIKPEGGGGTDHRPVFKFIDKKLPDTKLLICFTDGQTSYPDTPPSYPTIWVLGGSWRCDEDRVPWGKVVSLPKD